MKSKDIRFILTTFNKWQNSAAKSQAYNLKVVGSNPTLATKFITKCGL